MANKSSTELGGNWPWRKRESNSQETLPAGHANGDDHSTMPAGWPDEQRNDEISFVAWFAPWLALWAAYSMTDSWVRYKPIELALENQFRR